MKNLRPNQYGVQVDPDFEHAEQIRRVCDLLTFDGVLREGDSYVEIGAHRARFLRESGMLRPDCKYLLIEPQPKLAADLMAYFVRQDHVRVMCAAVDIGRISSPFATLTASETGDQGANIEGGEGQTLCLVGSVCLGDIVEYHAGGRVRFLAMNCEQAEYRILRDPCGLKHCDYVVFEAHPGKSGIKTKEFIAEHLEEKFRVVGFAREGEDYEICLLENRQCSAS